MATAAKILGVAPASISKICGVAKASVKYVMGVELVSIPPPSYPESNQDGDFRLYNASANHRGGQAITLASGLTINTVRFYLRKYSGSPTGNMYAVIYGCTGSVGSTGKGTGSALATSSAVAVSTLTSSYALIEFTFSGGYIASAGDLVIACEYGDGTETSAEISMGYDGSSPTDTGNMCYFYNGSWGAYGNRDAIYYINS